MWKYGPNQNQMGGGSGPGAQQGGGNIMPLSGYNMQSPSHIQQHMQIQQQQMNLIAGGGAGNQIGGNVGPGGMSMNVPGGIMHQQSALSQQMVGTGGNIGIGPMSGMGGSGALAMNVQGGLMQPQALTLQHPQIAQQGNQANNNNMLVISQQNPHKEINIVQLSRLGQETVQDIASRFQEVFSALKIIQPTPNRDNNTEKKVQEYFRTIRLLFKRVRIIYEKCNDAGMDYTHVESLIPYRDEPDSRIEAAQCDEYRKVLQENQELIETVKLKNRQLREIIDRTRIIIWEINTMLSMRRS